MISMSMLLTLTHLLGLSLGLGSATIKTILLLKCITDRSLVPAYLRVAKLITRVLISGIALLALSGIAWMFLGYSFTPLLILKHVLVAIILILGPIIDNVATPKYEKLAPSSGHSATVEFKTAQRQLVAIEIFATLLFYVITVIGVLI